MKKLHLTAMAGAGVLLLGVGLYHRAPARAAADAGQPAPEIALRAYVVPSYTVPKGFGSHRVYLDSGHGAEGNPGNQGAWCQQEQDFTRDLALDLAQRLEATGHFEVKLSRNGEALVEYATRVAEAHSWRAEVLLSLHSDVRGTIAKWAPGPGQSCPRSRQAPGFSVLWSDEAEEPLRDRRLALARSLARQLQRMGSLAYDGAGYRDMYEDDALQPGVFVDRHLPDKRIFMLRKPSMPAVIIETHNAIDDREAQRWELPATREAFAAAVTAALVEVLHGDG